MHTKEYTKDEIKLLIAAIDLLPNPVFIKDRDHKWVEANHAFCELLGRTREELIGKTDFDVCPHDAAQLYWKRDDEVLKTKTEDISLDKTTSSSGTVSWVESRKVYFENDLGEPFIIAIVNDITELKMREDAVIAAENKANAALESKSDFLANIGHEIRTPMNGVLGMAQILRHTILTEEQESIVTTLERSGESLLAILNDILDFSKMIAGKLEIEPAPFNPSTAIEDVAAMLSHAAGEKNIELIVNLQPDLPPAIIGDIGRIRQVLVNLVGNAIKFTEEGYVLLTVTADIDDDMCRLTASVEDTGIGIPGNKLKNIFNQFEGDDGSPTRRFAGTGLGLAITQNLVEKMGGEISASSVYGQGATFTFTLELPIDEQYYVASSAGIIPVDIVGTRVLIVDDIQANREILETQTRALGAVVTSVSGAREAARELLTAAKTKQPFDILITDYQMPDIDGLRFVRTLRKKTEFDNLRIIVLTSVDHTDVKTAFTSAGVTACLAKPLRAGTLERTLNLATAAPDCITRAEDVIKPAVAPSRQRLPSGSAYRLLVAEDNEVNRKVVKGLLAPMNYTLDFAENGQVALDMFRRQEYDLVLMDISMPIMDGILATQSIRAFEAQRSVARTPIIALTGHALANEEEHFYEAGMDDFVPKPIRIEMLEEAINRWLDAETLANSA